MNERIRAREVRLIDENGVQLGIMSSQEALRIARERDFDLIEVAPQAQPPVCRIMDYGKHKYEQAKREREARKKSRSSEVRLLRMKVQISQHDLDVKMRKVRELLAEGSKVRVTLRFRGREMSRPELGTNLLDRIREALADAANMEGQPRREGRMMSVMLVPKPGAKPPKEKKKEAPRPDEQEKMPPKPAEEKEEKATADVKEQVQEEPVAERPRQAEDAEDSGEAG